MTFERPDLLWIVPAALGVLALAFVLHTLRRRRVGRAFGGWEPARRLTGIDLRRIPHVRYLLVALGVAAVTLAGAGPRDPDPPRVDPARPVEAVVALDISRSMSVDDVEPSRSGRARELTLSFLELLPADRIGLVGFARQAYALAPPTRDHDVVRYFLDALEPDLLLDRDQGTRTTEALQAAADLLERHASEDAHRIVIVISDGESHEERARAVSQASALREAGIRVFTVGVGTAEGVQLMRRDYRGNPVGPLLGSGGEPVVTTLDADFLGRLADAGGGAYLDGGPDAGDGPAAALLDHLGREPPERRGRMDAGRRDLPYLLGMLGLALLVAESGGAAVARRRQDRRKGGER